MGCEYHFAVCFLNRTVALHKSTVFSQERHFTHGGYSLRLKDIVGQCFAEVFLVVYRYLRRF